jgi:hypothetical protein
MIRWLFHYSEKEIYDFLALPFLDLLYLPGGDKRRRFYDT